ncbi:unnamed protein product [Penicillium discolor]
MSDTRPSLMLRKFLEDIDSADVLRQNQTESDNSPEDVLKSSERPPVMRRARVIGYEIKLWGPYPALLDGEPFHLVDGMTYEILSQTQLDQLAAYETDKYQPRPCLINLLNDDDSVEKTIEGFAFMWDGQQDELREGTFDLKQWKKEKQLADLD